MIGEFVGTVLFLLFALGGANVGESLLVCPIDQWRWLVRS